MATTRSTPRRGPPCGFCTGAPTTRRGPPPSAVITTARSGPRSPNSRPAESRSPKPSSAGPSPAWCWPHCRRSSSGPAPCAGRPLTATGPTAATGASSSARRRRARRPRDKLRAPPTRRTRHAATSTEAATTTDAPGARPADAPRPAHHATPPAGLKNVPRRRLLAPKDRHKITLIVEPFSPNYFSYLAGLAGLESSRSMISRRRAAPGCPPASARISQ